MSMQQEQGNQEIANARQYMITSTSNATTMPVPSELNSSVALMFARSNLRMLEPNTRVMWSNPKLSAEDIALLLDRAQ